MMKTMRTLLLLIAGGFLLLAVSAQAEVYKTVDKDGNVVFTDRQPEPGAEPIKMRELSVVPVPEPSPQKAVRALASDVNEDGEVVDLGALRRGYRDFKIVQPEPEQTFVGTGNIATIAWDTQYALQDGMNVIVTINGQAMPPTTQQVIATQRLDRGEHQVSAELRDPLNRTVAKAPAVTFFVRQNTVNRRAVVAPRARGGG